MKVSVIVPVYNLENYIRDCIVGLVEQDTSFDYEVLAIDDASTDDSYLILTDLQNIYKDKLKIYKNKVNLGLAKTMKKLLSLSQGNYIAYLDGDDIALPGKLQKQADYLDKHKDCSIVYHESNVFDSETNKTLWTYSKDYYNWKYITQKATIEHVIRYGCFMHASTVMVRRHEHMIEAVSEKNVILHDHSWHALNLIYGQGSIDFINETLGRYRIHKDSFGAQTLRSHKRREQVLKDQLNVCELAEKLGVAENIIKAGIYHYQYATALYFLKAKEYELFIQYINQSSDGQWFFDIKHRDIYNNKNNPKQLLDTYF
ncbi:MAG: glycosyltransferase [Gammaproteobacteria bacterium]|nr:glycosyltransferase [Gammaproteobacteria bacterium]